MHQIEGGTQSASLAHFFAQLAEVPMSAVTPSGGSHTTFQGNMH